MNTFRLVVLAVFVPILHASAQNPTAVPDRVILTWSGDTSTTQSVTWRTDTTVKAGAGQIAESAPGPSFDPLGSKEAAPAAKTVPAKTEYLKSSVNEAHDMVHSFDDIEIALPVKAHFVRLVQ